MDAVGPAAPVHPPGSGHRAGTGTGAETPSPRWCPSCLSGALWTWGADDGSYDLVSASYFHSPVDTPRSEILVRAPGLVAQGGRLLIVSHADFPPWSAGHDTHEHRFLTAEEEIDELKLDPAEWSVHIAETCSRATGPDGQQAVLDDVVVLLRRH